MKISVLIFLIFTIIHSIRGEKWDWIETLPQDVNEYLRSGVKSDNFKQAWELLRFRTAYKGRYQKPDIKFLDELRDEEKGVVSCTLCRNILDVAFTWVENGDSRDEIVEKFVDLCVSLEVSTDRVCRGAAESNVDIALWIIETKNQTAYPLTSSQICGFASYPDCNLNGEQFQWTLDLSFLGTKPTPEVPQPPPGGSPTLKVLQFTDVHVDPNYLPGGNAECDEPMCCRFDQGEAVNQSGIAGYWGDYRYCDAPVHAYQNMLQDAAIRHPDVSYVIFTGDIVDHASWITNEQYNRDLITFAITELGRYFPSVPVIPILGNHEAHPSNVFTDPLKTEIPSNISSTWLYELSNELWSTWLPPSTTASILDGGMYTVDITPQLTLIGINSMACLAYNWWLMYDNVDPYGQLIWLGERLLEAEVNNKKVHILAHVPSGFADCMHMWSIEYRRIIDRFENTVVAQFHGHTHWDHFSVYYDLSDQSRATNVAFTAGSGTPYNDVNPNYRVYTVDGEYQDSSYRVLDHETWFYNLTEANLAGPDVTPNWQKLYTFSEAYEVESLLPEHMDQLVYRMAQDVSLQQQYWEFYVKKGDTSLAAGCDSTCLQNLAIRNEVILRKIDQEVHSIIDKDEKKKINFLYIETFNIFSIRTTGKTFKFAFNYPTIFDSFFNNFNKMELSISYRNLSNIHGYIEQSESGNTKERTMRNWQQSVYLKSILPPTDTLNNAEL